MSQDVAANGKKAEPVRAIQTLIVQGFKSLADEHQIEIRPLTLLAGANSSGKSSALQPFLMLKQTLEATYDPGPLLLDGPNVRFTAAEQFLSQFADRPRSDELVMGLWLDDEATFLNEFAKSPNTNIQLNRTRYSAQGVNYTDLYPRISEIPTSNLLQILAYWEIPLSEYSSDWRFEYYHERCFIDVRLWGKKLNSLDNVSFPLNLSDTFSLCLRQLIHIPGLRSNPERTYKQTATGPMFPGTFEIYVASIIGQWQSSQDERLRELERDLITLGLTNRVEARRINEVQFEVRVGQSARSAATDETPLISIADVGLGVSQVLPVLVALLVAAPGQMVYIEQPEIHLHPRAQARLAQVLVKAANRGVRVVVETHSSLLLTAVQTCAARGEVAPHDVMLHWFQRGEDGTTNISSTELDETGAFGDWPEDFADVEMEVESDYIDAAQTRLMERLHDSSHH